LTVTYRLLPNFNFDELKPVLLEAADILPGGPEVLKSKGWDGFLEYYLGEGQFGPERYNLSGAKHLYYQLKPILPRSLVRMARRNYRAHQENNFPLNWPIEPRFVRFLHQVFEKLSSSPSAISHPWPVQCGANFTGLPSTSLALWPSGHQFSFILTHDVETEKGLQCVKKLADIDARHGFRSSFNFVPERYSLAPKLRAELNEQGFEVGVHGLKHDGKLFFSKEIFDKRAVRINHYLEDWGAVGFRSPLTHRNPEWMQSLEIEYDSSFFDTDPYETMPGGTMSIWPFSIGHFIELPYTLPQDSTLFITLRETSIDIWKRKLDWIAENQGMALVNVHPDYIDFDNGVGGKAKGGKYPLKFYLELLDYVKSKGNYWHALPREVARWWRTLNSQFKIIN
jgi:peptidoglycan/xylan/chitin deacetylase (PgdA/CDA1 family)